MSKKILKRSLALGALMAFVITGSAWAGELTSNEVGADGFKIIGGIGNQDGLPSGETTDGNWKLNGYKLIVNKEAKYGYAVYANGYSFQGDAGSTLEIKASDGNEKLTYGLGVDGTIKVDNLIIESESRAIYGAAPTTITAKNISITADEIAVITEPGTQQLSITSTELLNLQGDIVAESGAVSIDAKKGEIKGDIYSHEWFNKEGKSSGASTVSVKLGKDSILTGKVVTDNVSTTKFELNGGAIWNVTDDSNISYITGTSYKVTGTGEQNLTVVNEKNTGDVDSNGIYSTGTAEITGLEKLDVTSANRHALEVAAGMRITNVGTVKLNTTNSGNGIQAYGDLYIDNVDTLEIDVVNHGIRAAKQDGHDANVNINVKDLIIRGDETALKASSGAEIDVTATETAVVEGDIVAEDTGKVGLEISGTTSRFTGAITTSEGAATTLTLNNGASWEITGVSTVTNVAGNEGKLVVTDTKNGVTIDNNSNNSLTVQASEELTTAIENGDTTLQNVAQSIKVETGVTTLNVATAETDIAGSSVLTYNAATKELGAVQNLVNAKNQAISDAGVNLKAHWRAHMNDMNKRMGELRDANGEAGVWTRMVRGEAEFDGAKAQYNQYQVGYDQKTGDWYVGAAVTYAEGDSNYGYGSTDDKSTAFAIYGSKLNQDGSFIDLIARYANVESELDDIHAGTGDYDTDGYSISAEYGKRLQQGNGLWVEPQVELTYGTLDSADFVLSGTGKEVHVGDIDSLIGRVGFRIGKDIKEGNVYARASYLYDFDGETTTNFSKNGKSGDRIKEDLGGGWWEVGVGANINLSKATYIYADVEKTFGGEVDTNWQWNLGVRYSF